MSNFLKEIVDTIPVFFFLWGLKEKETIFISEKFYDQKAKDYYAPNKTRADLRQYIHPESHDIYDQFFSNLTTKNDFNDEVELKAGDNLPNITWIKINTFPVIKGDQEVEHIAGQISDISRSLEQSRLLEEQVKSLDTVTFMLAHEISSPVSNIMGISELLKSKAEEGDQDKLLHLYDSIYNFGGEILTIARGLVGLLELQSSRGPFSTKEKALKPIVDHLISNFYFKPNTTTTKLSADQIEEDVVVQVSVHKFKQALEELLVYLLKFTKRDGEIILSTQPSASEVVEIQITSANIDLPVESIQMVLDRSSRLSLLDVKGRKIQGMLELILAKEIIELHQGRLSLLNEHQQMGFTITLPTQPDLTTADSTA